MEADYLWVECSAVAKDLDVQNSRFAALDTVDGLLERLIQIVDIVHPGGEQVSSCSGLGNASVVRDGIERDVDLLISGLGPEAIGMDQEERSPGCVPA